MNFINTEIQCVIPIPVGYEFDRISSYRAENEYYLSRFNLPTKETLKNGHQSEFLWIIVKKIEN